ncbi:hypothetical protein R55214_HHFBAMCI_01541 [Fructobacillus evanidus]|uniref:Integral membrane protein n=1 Tax=Fructobacillus evanidus TaxID=3064281 RepID=A0ABM9N1X5_9LACO|nr:MAG: hypothetical protein [Caudoviricetes sp.]CAK1223780.1 hypothetical protein R55250_KEHBDPNM_00410 [Fructobacillus sp. LMG 32999]CAK1248340.1 hypothetical protein R53534_HOPDCFKK_01166 [Fructobacillus sp. LMG 32999]CAK1249167.1 hypothetical protein R53718_MFFEMHAI_01572 [Fructobacillus sp. LMG 32999]CAK1254313.1 hypothetical protein R55214_HHFBAMCI_01541 [Fructobacillus sp. LMG 32999]
MKRHFWKNRQWVTIAIEEIIVGIIVMLHYQQLDVRLPPALGLLDDAPFGLLYLTVGVVLLVNSLWDFYWHRIRLVLIALSGGLWTMLTVSYALSDFVTNNVTIIPFIFGIITINVFLSAWIEPRHKLKGGGRY